MSEKWNPASKLCLGFKVICAKAFLIVVVVGLAVGSPSLLSPFVYMYEKKEGTNS